MYIFKSKGIKIIHPRPYEKVGLSFILSGWISKFWFDSRSGINYQIYLDFLNARGSTFMGSSFFIGPSKSWVQRLLGRVPFYQLVRLSDAGIHSARESQGRIAIKLSGRDWDKQTIIVPIIIKELEPKNGADDKTTEMHRTISERTRQYKIDLENFSKEMGELSIKRESLYQQFLTEDEGISGVIDVQDEGVLGGIYNILNFSEDAEGSAIYKKYREALNWAGGRPVGGVVGTFHGFKFTVYSNDHDPKHFHVIHRGRGVNARFSYPQIGLINYMNFRNTISSSEVDNIRNYFQNPENFKKLGAEFGKTI